MRPWPLLLLVAAGCDRPTESGIPPAPVDPPAVSRPVEKPPVPPRDRLPVGDVRRILGQDADARLLEGTSRSATFELSGPARGFVMLYVHDDEERAAERWRAQVTRRLGELPEPGPEMKVDRSDTGYAIVQSGAAGVTAEVGRLSGRASVVVRLTAGTDLESKARALAELSAP